MTGKTGRSKPSVFMGENKMFGLGSLVRIISPLLFQGFEIYKNWKDNRVIRDLQRKVKTLRILVGALAMVILLMLVGMMAR